jgi:two-component system nitrogen regulation sensor histidine kinase NtrY
MPLPRYTSKVPFRFLRRLGFRNRILLALLLLGAVPSAILSLGWVSTLLQFNPARSSRAVLDTVRVTGQALLETLDSMRLREPRFPGDSLRFTPRESLALDEHVKAINLALIRAETGFHYARLRAIALAIGIVMLGLFLLTAAIYLARSLARGLSRPTDELVGWMEKIRRHEPLPEVGGASSEGRGEGEGGAPEFSVLRQALRETAAALQQGRAAELESERLRAFREVARRVAHEMKNPLTPIRFAVGQLEKTAGRPEGQTAGPDLQEALEVLRVETVRLEQLAREFANLGRLPEGPAAEVDLGELLAELLRTSVPETMRPVLRVDAAAPRIIGHYDPLHRAFSNLIRNAVEASREKGTIEVGVGIEEGPESGSEAIGGVRVTIADHGPGVMPDQRSRIFEPYVTNKAGGTGLGLALVKQAIEFHRGTIEVVETPGGGATFVVRLPIASRSPLPPLERPPFVERRVAERRRRAT